MKFSNLRVDIGFGRAGFYATVSDLSGDRYVITWEDNEFKISMTDVEAEAWLTDKDGSMRNYLDLLLKQLKWLALKTDYLREEAEKTEELFKVDSNGVYINQ